MTQLFAQPYDISATGFYFESADEYGHKADACKNSYGDPVEEFEIQFIDGEQIDCEFAKALGLYQSNIESFFDAVDDWSDDQKIRFIIAKGECGYDLDPAGDNVDQIDLDIYEVDTLEELAEQFLDEGLFGDVPQNLVNYISLEAIARDLAVDYAMTTVGGDNFAYRCG